MNAVIVDIKKKQAAALDENGRVVRIHNVGYEIGQTIELHEVKPVRTPTVFKRLSTGVAAAVLVAMIGTGTAYAMPYGTVTLDGDSSIEYTINCFDYVLDIKAINEEGETLLAEIDEAQLRHHRIDAAIGTTMEQFDQREPPEGEMPELHIHLDIPSETHSDRLREELAPVVERESRQPEPPAEEGPHEEAATHQQNQGEPFLLPESQPIPSGAFLQESEEELSLGPSRNDLAEEMEQRPAYDMLQNAENEPEGHVGFREESSPPNLSVQEDGDAPFAQMGGAFPERES